MDIVSFKAASFETVWPQDQTEFPKEYSHIEQGLNQKDEICK